METEFFEKEQEFITKDTESYISNPLHAFKLIKQFTNDSLLIKEKVMNSVERFSIQTSSFPKKADLEGAVAGLERLQLTYNLKTEDLVAGIIDGDKYNVTLSIHDAFVIGTELLNAEKFPGSIEYFYEALRKVQEPTQFIEVGESQILYALAQAHQGNGEFKKAIEIADNAVERKFLSIQRFIDLKRDLELKLKEGKVEVKKAPKEALEVSLTRRVCNGDIYQSPAEKSALHCRYLKKTAFSKLAPYKIEEANLDPKIVIFHEVISENEIETLKQLAIARLKSSVIFTKEGLPEITSSVRISKVAWFDDRAHMLIKRISTRIEDMTGLSMKSAESLQVQKYGIAGFYKSHYDFTGGLNVSSKSFEEGDRIATFLLYLNDVEKGGATAFPYLRAKISAEKGAATFWYNLFPSGAADYRTRHSGCPVFVGSKWVANKWIHEHGQEWRRPCDLNFTKNNEKQVIENFRRLFGDKL